MTAPARDLLAAFDALDPVERREVTAEILRRSAGCDGLSEEKLHELAADLFRSYDIEEASGATH